MPCPGLNSAAGTCSGHGQCSHGATGSGNCTCDLGWRATECTIQCPGQGTCSGHGTCDDFADCTCEAHYYRHDCSKACPGTSPDGSTTCSTHGTCTDGTNGTGVCTCEYGYWGAGCENECDGGAATPCSGHGTCSSGREGTGMCTCAYGWIGVDCGGECVGGAATPCNGHGQCDSGRGGSGQCTCSGAVESGFWNGTECTACLGGWYSQDCTQLCQLCSGRGTCQDGRYNDGTCVCDAGTWGHSCEKDCPGGKDNVCAGHGTCDQGAGGTGSCTCSLTWFSADCSLQCPGTTNGVVCSGHGTCADGADGTGRCTCVDTYGGEACDLPCPGLSVELGLSTVCNGQGSCSTWPVPACTCKNSFYGVDCIGECPGTDSATLIACSGHGQCDDGALGFGLCACEPYYATYDCSVPCPGGTTNTTACSANGVCDHGADGSGLCACHPGFWGEACEHECPGGANYSCSLNGICNDTRTGDGTCTCFSDSEPGFWNASDCSICQDDYWGLGCENKCPDCVRGYCDAGLNGTGQCMCPFGTWGTYCGGTCPGAVLDGSGVYVDLCSSHGFCFDGNLGTGECFCELGYFGTACQKVCHGLLANGTSCNAHGVCDDGDPDFVKDLAFRQPVWTSSQLNETARGEFMVDGLTNTSGWHSEEDEAVSWIIVELNETTYVNHIILSVPGNVNSNYAFRVVGLYRSMDNVTWTHIRNDSVADCNTTAAGVQRDSMHRGWPEDTRFVKLVLSNRCPHGRNYVLSNMEVVRQSSVDDATGVCACDIAHRGPGCGMRCPGPADAPCHGNGVCNSTASCICNTGFFGHDCKQACQCSGHGSCFDGADGNGTCICDYPFFGTNCSERCPTTGGQVCSGHGICSWGVYGSGLCSCESFYWGEACAGECQGGVANPCNNDGLCHDGRTGDGECACFISADLGFFTGGVCQNCMHSYYGDACKTLCDNCNGRGNCSWGKTGTGQCTCEPGTYSRYCESDCPGGKENVCHGHGSCGDGRDGSGLCTCVTNFWGRACQKPCPSWANQTCAGHGTCFDGAEGNGTCACVGGYRRADCGLACPGVKEGKQSCNGHGLCNEFAACTCDKDFFGLDCGTPCPASNGSACGGGIRGTCDDGAEGTGACTCKSGFFGMACGGECPGGSANACTGHGTCMDGSLGTGTCVCQTGWTGEACDTCAPGYHGPTCAACPGGAALPCNGKGFCWDSLQGNGTCKCDRGWGGDACENECPGGYLSPCSEQGTCTPDGKSCVCEKAFAGSDCSIQCPGLVVSDKRRTLSFWGGGGGVISNNLAGCCSSSYNNSIPSWHQKFDLWLMGNPFSVPPDPWVHYAKVTPTMGMLFHKDYTNGKVGATGEFILPCWQYEAWGSNFVMKLEMGEITEYFRPRDDSLELCDMLTSNINHLWSGTWDGVYSQPTYMTQAPAGMDIMGGSGADWPANYALKYADEDLGGASFRITCGGNGVCNDGAAGDGTCQCSGDGHFANVPAPFSSGCDVCKAGYYGSRCTEECPACANGGKCHDGMSGNGTCTCKPGYFGPTCEGACQMWQGQICNAKGICDDGAQGSGACVCEKGWQGKMCQKECPGGAQNSCNGHGTCKLQLGFSSDEVVVCVCHGNFFGEECDQIVQEKDGVCHSYPFTNSLFPMATPGSPLLFTNTRIPYIAAPNGGRAAVLAAGTAAYATTVDFNYVAGFTVSAWVRVSSDPDCPPTGCNVFGRISGEGANTTFGYQLTVDNDGVAHFTVGNGPTLPRTVLKTSTAAEIGQWYHVAVAFDAISLDQGNMTFCLDGKCEFMGTVSGLVGYQMQSKFTLGGPGLNMSVDELWICTRPWEPYEIEQQYTNTQVTPTIYNINPAEGGPRGGQNVTVYGLGYDMTQPVIRIMLGDRAITPATRSSTSMSFVTPEYDMANIKMGTDGTVLPIRLLFGYEGQPNYKEAVCSIAAGCTFKYIKKDKRPKICHFWQFETPNPVYTVAPEYTHSATILSKPSGFLGSMASSPYMASSLMLSIKPNLYAESQHLNYPDFTLSAWVNLPNPSQCGNDNQGPAAPVHCTVAGRYTPKGSDRANTNADKAYNFGYLMTITNEGSPDGRFYAQVRIGNGPFIEAKHTMFLVPIQPGKWHHVTSKFMSARYSGDNKGVLTICVDGFCTSTSVLSTDILGYSQVSTFQVGGLEEKDWQFVGQVDELFICDYPLSNVDIYELYNKYFRNDPDLVVSVAPLKEGINARLPVTLTGAANKPISPGSFVWSITNPASWTLSSAMTLGSINLPAVRLAPGILQPGEIYTFQLCANSSKEDGTLEYACANTQLDIAPKAVIGSFVCMTTTGAQEGNELSDTFSLSVGGVVGKAPFKFSFSMQQVASDSLDTNLPTELPLSTGFLSEGTLFTILPRGVAEAEYSLKLFASVLDAQGFITREECTVQVLPNSTADLATQAAQVVSTKLPEQLAMDDPQGVRNSISVVATVTTQYGTTHTHSVETAGTLLSNYMDATNNPKCACGTADSVAPTLQVVALLLQASPNLYPTVYEAVLDFVVQQTKTASAAGVTTAKEALAVVDHLYRMIPEWDTDKQQEVTAIAQAVMTVAGSASQPGEQPTVISTATMTSSASNAYQSDLGNGTSSSIGNNQINSTFGSLPANYTSNVQHEQYYTVSFSQSTTSTATTTTSGTSMVSNSGVLGISLLDTNGTRQNVSSDGNNTIGMSLECKGCVAPRAPPSTEGLFFELPLFGNLNVTAGSYSAVARKKDGSPGQPTFDKEAMYFDGETYLEVPGLADYNWGSSLTVSIMYQRTYDKGHMGLVGNGFAKEGSWEVRAAPNDAGQAIGGGVTSDKWDFLDSAEVGVWHHVAMTYDGEKAEWWLDGEVETNELGPMGDLPVLSNPLYVGAANPTTDFFVGFLREVRLYGRVLEDDEIQALAANVTAMGAKCMFYNETTSQWSTDGVTTDGTSDGAMQCTSDHLTTFSVMIDSLVSPTSAKGDDSKDGGDAAFDLSCLGG